MDEFLSSRQTKTAVFGFGAGILSLIILYSVSDFFFCCVFGSHLFFSRNYGVDVSEKTFCY